MRQEITCQEMSWRHDIFFMSKRYQPTCRRHFADMSPTCRHVFDDTTFSLCPKESADMSADVVPTRHVMSSGMVRTTEFDDMSGRHSRHFPDMSACRRTTCRLGGSGDTTRRRHFQLRKNGHPVKKTVQTQKNQYSKVDVALFNSTKINKDLQKVKYH